MPLNHWHLFKTLELEDMRVRLRPCGYFNAFVALRASLLEAREAARSPFVRFSVSQIA
jgi:hypothetical protein